MNICLIFPASFSEIQFYRILLSGAFCPLANNRDSGEIAETAAIATVIGVVFPFPTLPRKRI